LNTEGRKNYKKRKKKERKKKKKRSSVGMIHFSKKEETAHKTTKSMALHQA